MLVLSRKQTESILIDNEIEITVIQVQGNRVKIGVRAPQDVPVVRTELLFDQLSRKTMTPPCP